MNVLLIKPYCLSDHIQPPLGLGYLANSIRARHNVRIVDCLKERIRTPGQLLGLIREFKADLVGIQCYTLHLQFIKEVFQGVKEDNPEGLCVIGGPHPSTVPEETMEWFGSLLDYGFIGEAEKSFARFVEVIAGKNQGLKDIPGLIWRKEGVVQVNPGELTEDLDTLGQPCWDLLKPQTYPESQHGAFYKKFPIAPIMTTRGCPYLCTFCAGNKVSGKKIRKHSVGYILEQIKLLYHDYNIREFHIIDDNFTFDLNYAKELLRGILNLKLNISWATPNGIRLDRIDNELLMLMKKSGLYLISLGIESGSDRMLKLMKKGTTVSQIKDSIRMIRRAGIEIAGFFILGYPGETRQEIESTIDLACELDLIRANFFTYLPFPGTESYKELQEKGELDKVDWSNFYFMSSPYVTPGLSREELKKYHHRAFLRFFLRPKIFFKNISQIKSLRHFKFLAFRFYNWILRR